MILPADKIFFFKVFSYDIKYTECYLEQEDVSKDQTYFLYRIPSEILEKVRFPLASKPVLARIERYS